MPAQKKPLQVTEISQHNSKKSCWVIIHGDCYDVTEFLPEHPGGQQIILKYAGKDATEAFDPIHPPNTLTEYLPESKHLGPVDSQSLSNLQERQAQEAEASKTPQQKKEEAERKKREQEKPDLSKVLNLYDFETVARSILPPAAWAYYSSGADDEITMRENHAAYQRVWWKPRILKDVGVVDTTGFDILGQKSSLPVYISATALGKLGHPKGELNLTRAAHTKGIIQMIPTLASFSFDEIIDTAQKGQTQFLQLYVNKDRAVSEKAIRKAEARGVKGLFITVDAPQLGRREKDMRMKFEDSGSNVQSGDSSVDRSQGAARAISSFIDPTLSWKDIPWFKSITKMPIVLKGVQRWEDAVLAAEAGCQGVVLSNHGGRQLDVSRSGLEILAETIPKLKERGLYGPNFQVFVDGGVRRAGDILKAIALGATAVGLGRPFLYAYCAYGEEGVGRAIDILQDEMVMNMRLLGAASLSDITPDMVDTSNISRRIVDATPNYLYDQNYERLPRIGQKEVAKL